MTPVAALRASIQPAELPRVEMRAHLHNIAKRVAPGLKLLDQLTIIARLCSQESGLEVGRGTVKDWWFSLDDDARRVDSRHMDWARARARSISANDNRIMAGTRSGDPRDCLPPSPILIAA